jgi:hypothetical protein
MTADDPRGEYTNVQRQGMDAVSDAFERFIEQLPPFAGPAAPGFATPDPGAGPADLRQIRAAVTRAIDVYADLLQRTFDLFADALEERARQPGATMSAYAGSPVELAGAPGTDARAPVWIHNSTDEPVNGLALRMTGLTADDGAAIDASTGTFSPPKLDVPADASGCSQLAVGIPPTTVPGIYHGHVLATGLAGASLYLRLVVHP